ncbi:MAG: hypothetical protein ACKVTZ_09515 [Bacteroidia bacterium]
MFKVIRNIPLPLHILLIVLAIVLRIPCFHADYYQADESLFGICAEKIVQGKTLYDEVWFSGPPLIVWFYSLFTFFFGKFWLIAMRIFTVFYVYLLSTYFGGWMAEYRPFDKYPFIAPVFMVLLTSSPWYALEMNTTLFSLLPMLMAYMYLIEVSERNYADYQSFVFAGMLMMVCFLTTYLSGIMFLALLVLYLTIRRAAFDEMLAILGGAGVVLGLGLFILYMGDSLGGFLDMGVLYKLDLLRYEIFFAPFRDSKGALSGFLAVEGVFLILAIIGATYFRLKYYTLLVKIRRLEVAMLIWLVAGLFGLLFSLSQVQLHEWVLLAPPLAFYATKVFDFKIQKGLSTALLIGCFVPSFFVFSGFWIESYKPQKQAKAFAANQKKKEVVRLNPIIKNEELTKYFAKRYPRKGIWLMEFKPELYLYLNKTCATKYVDYRLAYQKFHCLPYASGTGHTLISKLESDAEIFEEFQKNLPDFIVDKSNLFPNLQEMYPVLFYNYKADNVGEYKIYHR